MFRGEPRAAGTLGLYEPVHGSAPDIAGRGSRTDCDLPVGGHDAPLSLPAPRGGRPHRRGRGEGPRRGSAIAPATWALIGGTRKVGDLIMAAPSTMMAEVPGLGGPVLRRTSRSATSTSTASAARCSTSTTSGSRLLTQNTAPIHVDRHYSARHRVRPAAGRLHLHARPRHRPERRRTCPRTSWPTWAGTRCGCPHPVFEGDTIYSESEVLAVRASRLAPGGRASSPSGAPATTRTASS